MPVVVECSFLQCGPLLSLNYVGVCVFTLFTMMRGTVAACCALFGSLSLLNLLCSVGTKTHDRKFDSVIFTLFVRFEHVSTFRSECSRSQIEICYLKRWSGIQANSVMYQRLVGKIIVCCVIF